ncbi:MAG: hypothetical protein KBG15_12700 [Kofleriaceae bacterium]|nr:hypothetical protein [Kofleriaceae bacterium]
MKWQVSTLWVVGFALSTGCGELGDRAVGGCPADEVCNQTTPSGLVFSGAGTLAAGGTATVTFDHAEYVRGPDGGYRHPAFTQPFVATVDDERVMIVAAQGAARVALRARAAGESRLRIEDVDGQLFDRLTIKIETIWSQTLVGNGLQNVAPATPIAFATGMVEFSVAHVGSTGTRLIDTSAQVTADVAIVPVAATGVTGAAAQSHHYAFEALQPQRVTVSVKAGDRASEDLALDVVASIDRVATTEPSYAIAAPDGSAVICFAGYHDVRAVANLAWSFTVDGVIQDKNFVENCVIVAATAGHIPVVEATARGVTGRASIVVMAAPKTLRAVPVAADEVAGDRALGNAAENAKPPAEASGARTPMIKN